MMRAFTVPVAVLLVMGVAQFAAAQSPEEILSQFEAEPTILEVQEAAAAYAHIDQDMMSGWSARASASALLPRVRVQYQATADDDISTDDNRDFEVLLDGTQILTDVDQDQTVEDDDQVRIVIQGDWDLRELIFNPDVLRITNETSDLVELREDILVTVTSLYFERRRAQVQLLVDPPSDAVERIRRELEIQELTAGIDALTGAWFSDQLSAAGLPTY
jgi:hypothetical protein